MKKVCVITSTRADYGLLRKVIAGIQFSSKLKLQLVVTGTHLLPEYGDTFKEILSDGFVIDRMIPIQINGNTEEANTISMGVALISFAKALKELDSDLVIILGDRYEIIAVALAAVMAGIPIAHIHGGEKTEGSIDELFRHSITKLSHYHFVAAKEYGDRIEQMGENPYYIYNVGGLGADNIASIELYDRSLIEEKLKVKFKKYNYLVTYHPETMKSSGIQGDIKRLLSALKEIQDAQIIFTMPNSDAASGKVLQEINYFISNQNNAILFSSLGVKMYLSVMAQCNAVIGNSSSGIIEAPYLKVPTINIGYRQKGRLRSQSIIDCDGSLESIRSAFLKISDERFISRIKNMTPAYGFPGASDKIVKLIEEKADSFGYIKIFNDLQLHT